ncbi:MAG: transcriptional repressor [Deltaproteobacteria bacterium]|nr:transcriptional repressor [Deltaproteobacteria bacterium]MBW2362775.1 transcriptional repressor [Deltaproteobacteria bacterium]
MSHEVEHSTLSRFLDEHSLKHTKQREAVLDVFLEAQGHVTGEQIHQQVREAHPQIGYTTVYRTMKLLCDAGLANERHFDDGMTRYEIAHEHHDHLICTKCGKIVEFDCTMIARSQNDIAERYGFRVLRHRHELYGHCETCREDP